MNPLKRISKRWSGMAINVGESEKDKELLDLFKGLHSSWSTAGNSDLDLNTRTIKLSPELASIVDAGLFEKWCKEEADRMKVFLEENRGAASGKKFGF